LRITSTSDPANADRMFIMQPVFSGASPDSAQGMQERSWSFGSYLLLKGDHTYINMYGAVTGTRLQWYPEYQVNLGAAQDPGGMPTTVDGYYDPGSQLYIRQFQNGLVLVNNSGRSLVYSPGQVMQQVIVNGWGGGVRPGDINPVTNTYIAGWLSSQLVNSVTVGPYSSVILINQGTPIQIPPPGGGGGDSAVPPFRSVAPVDLSTSAVTAGEQYPSTDGDSGSTMSPMASSPDLQAQMPGNAVSSSDLLLGHSGRPVEVSVDVLPTLFVQPAAVSDALPVSAES
jgi:Hypothetical glycosyl hydrolase family 15